MRLSTETIVAAAESPPMSAYSDDLLEEYSSPELQFRYPAAWELRKETENDDTLITVTADDCCFCVLRLMPARPRPPAVVRSCISALRGEYEDIEVTRPETRLSGLPTCSREATFTCFELLNAAGFASARGSRSTVLIWWQCTDHELPVARPLFDQLIQSVRIPSSRNLN
ncbi:MAG: hypothetical protein RLZZ458_488 [Planctomycetota bacterium]